MGEIRDRILSLPPQRQRSAILTRFWGVMGNANPGMREYMALLADLDPQNELLQKGALQHAGDQAVCIIRNELNRILPGILTAAGPDSSHGEYTLTEQAFIPRVDHGLTPGTPQRPPLREHTDPVDRARQHIRETTPKIAALHASLKREQDPEALAQILSEIKDAWEARRKSWAVIDSVASKPTHALI